MRDKLEKILIKKRTTPQTSLGFEVHVTDHCNLNCAGCSHFAPLAEAYYLNPDSFAADCSRISLLTGGQLRYLSLLGGEPLLHPELTKLITIARSSFTKKMPLMLVTNGITLAEQGDAFWLCCAEHDAQVAISKYPIEISVNLIQEKARQFKVHCGYYVNVDVIEPLSGKTIHKNDKGFCMQRTPFELTGQQNIVENFKYCGFANSCITLREGRLYTCAPAAYSQLFSDFFNANLQKTDADSIDIYQNHDLGDVLARLAVPIPFCRYCNVKGRSGGHKWSVSRKDLTEWT